MARKNFTLIELLIVIAVIAILAAMLLPAMSRARNKAYQIECLNNLKQLNLAMQGYAGDYEGYLPIAVETVPGISGGVFWTDKIVRGGVPSKKINHEGYWKVSNCRVAATLHNYPPTTTTYSLNNVVGTWSGYSIYKYEQAKFPSRTCFASDGYWKESGPWFTSTVNNIQYPETVHNGRSNILFFDGHAELVRIIGAYTSSTTVDGRMFWLGVK